MSWHSIPPNTRRTYNQILTPKQLDILRHRSNGHSWLTIALALDLDEATVRGHYRRAINRIRRHRNESS